MMKNNLIHLSSPENNCINNKSVKTIAEIIFDTKDEKMKNSSFIQGHIPLSLLTEPTIVSNKDLRKILSKTEDNINKKTESNEQYHLQYITQKEKLTFLYIKYKIEKNKLYESAYLANKQLLKVMTDNNMQAQLTRHYIPAINQNSSYQNKEKENYKIYCGGRTKAYHEHSYTKKDYPAATCIGIQENKENHIHIYALGTKASSQKIHNPEQTDFHDYEKKYTLASSVGPTSSRGRILENDIFLLSGTAAIKKSTSQHPKSLSKQTSVTLDNINIMIQEVEKVQNEKNLSYQKGQKYLKIYIRNPKDPELYKAKEIITQWCKNNYCPEENIMYLSADICRQELLIEIEGIFYPTNDSTKQ